MELILKIDLGTPAEISAAVDVFSRFYRAQFTQSALKSSIKQQKLIYLAFSIGTSFTALCGIVLFFTLPSNYSIIMAVMVVFMFIVAVYSINRYRQVPDRCSRNIETNLENQFKSAKDVKQAVFELQFFENQVEARSNRQSRRPLVERKRYSEIKHVYETEELYYFSGLTWILKSRLDDSQREALTEIINKYFEGDRHRVIPASE